MESVTEDLGRPSADATAPAVRRCELGISFRSKGLGEKDRGLVSDVAQSVGTLGTAEGEHP